MKSKEAYNVTNNSLEVTRLIDPGQLATWYAQRPYLWQMKLLDADSLARLTGTFGFGLPFDREAITQLWQLGFLKADIIKAPTKPGLRGFVRRGLYLVDGFREFGETEYLNLYSDERQLRLRKRGYAGTAQNLQTLDAHVDPLFHPFRGYVLVQLECLLESWISPHMHLWSRPDFQRVSLLSFKRFSERSKAVSFISSLEKWNAIASLAVALEPCFYQRLFGGWLSLPIEELMKDEADIDADTELSRDSAFGRLRREIDEHWTRNLEPNIVAVGQERLEEVRQDLCIASERMDPNKDLHTLLRLERDRHRLELKGRIGAAVYLSTMAEMTRRAGERAFHIRLPEEDERGFGEVNPHAKLRRYGSLRVVDGDPTVAAAFVHHMGLDYRPSLRWYVEGATEYFAFREILDAFHATNVGMVNLSGQFIEKRDLIFGQNLRADIEQQIFSYVSLDKGISKTERDIVRLVKEAARNLKMFGSFFLSEPDFEFANFELAELEEVLWGMGREVAANGMPDSDATSRDAHDSELLAKRVALHAAIVHATSGRELIEAARKSIPELNHLSKGEKWGRHLMRFAWEHQQWRDNQVRPMVEAVTSALRLRNSSYVVVANLQYTDPETGQLCNKPHQ